MLEIKDLKKRFKAKEVLKNLNFSINEGEIVCLLGNNGAGKTTLINCILRMIQADSGSILLDGRDIFTYKNKEYFSEVNALLEHRFRERENQNVYFPIRIGRSNP